MTTLWPAVRRALTGGRFVTGWTFVAVFVVSVTLLAPLPVGLSVLPRALVGAAGAAAVSAVWAGVALVERAASDPRVRAGVIVSALVLTAAARPPLQDALSRLGELPVPPPADAPLRLLTNLVVWTIALIGTAALVDVARSIRETNALLAQVLAQWDGSAARVRGYTTAARADILAAADLLAAARFETTADVRALTVDLRTHAHRLDERAIAPPAPGDPLDARAPRAVPRRPSRLRLPPPGLAATVYALAVLPYALRSVAPVDLLVGFCIALLSGAAADLAARLPPLRRRPRARGTLFVTTTLLAGLTLAAVAMGQGVPLATASLAVLAYPALAFALAAGRSTAHALRVERRRLSSALAARGRADDLGTRRVRAALRRAAVLLHADAQGAAVQFVLRHPDAAPADLAVFAAELRGLGGELRTVLDRPTPPAAADSLGPVLQTWGAVMPVSADVSDAASAALRTDPALARDVIDVVSEGLLNAAKHARERTARVEVRVTGTAGGPRLSVRIVSPGAPAPRARLRPGSHAARRGARLRAEGADAVLEAVFAVEDPTTTTRSVVWTEHSDGTPRHRA
ncbi:hypothetical protein NS220_16995 [Microbacterium testaceum]|uniref:Signal transduction histidine kinase n=1 Tax=Microbacterium testaceum TaxID=2033 RepID=A0A147EST4_MICTE|nr:hypothetical protein [Microbacterium testaceum]KTR87830.1 hypothetical protein NS220_16995 [Microbacterium testaceum]